MVVADGRRFQMAAGQHEKHIHVDQTADLRSTSAYQQRNVHVFI